MPPSNRPCFYHPYKASAPSSPAGIRIVDYLKSPKRCFNVFQGPDFTNARSPDPSPLSSPIRSYPEDNDPPTLRLADLLANYGFGSPKRPSTPTSDHPRNAHAPAQDPLKIPPRRKTRYGPKHLSFTASGKLRPSVSSSQRSQKMKEKQDLARRRTLGRRANRSRRKIASLRKEADVAMTPGYMDEHDNIFLKQLRRLQVDDEIDVSLEKCRLRMSRAVAESEERRREHERRDEEAAMMWERGREGENGKEQEGRKEIFLYAREEEVRRVDEERQRVHQAMERKIREEQEAIFRQKLAHEAKEEKERRKREEERRRQEEESRKREEEEHRNREERLRREEEERQKREERLRRFREETERLQRLERERQLRECKQQQEFERLRREAYERSTREEEERLAREEQEHQTRLRAEQTRQALLDEQIRQHFALYEAKWKELRTSNSIPPIDVQEIPWPVFAVVSFANQITYQDVRTFLFHPLQPGAEGKTTREMVKSEVLRFHPDKFNTRVLPRIHPAQREVAQEIAGAVARILTRIMTEEEQQ